MSRSTTGRGRERRCLGPELTAYADRVHSEFVRAGFEKLEQFRQQLAAR